jgi:hypothetical protein
MNGKTPKGKSWAEIFWIPFVLAVVGILGTFFITKQQEISAQVKADSDRQVKILEIFSEKITSPDENQRVLAVKLLRVIDDDLATKIAEAVAEVESPETKVSQAAAEVATEARARRPILPRIYVHVKSDTDREHALAVVNLLETQQFVVPGIQRVGPRSPNESQLRYFRKSEKNQAEHILQILKQAGYSVSLAYIDGYEDSSKIGPLHFELWFAEDEPEQLNPAPLNPNE